MLPETDDSFISENDMNNSQSIYFNDDNDVSAYEEIEDGNLGNENICIDFNNIHENECKTEYQQFIDDEIDNWSNSTEQSVWSVCSSDEDSDTDSNCFFLYDDEDDDLDTENEIDCSDYWMLMIKKK